MDASKAEITKKHTAAISQHEVCNSSDDSIYSSDGVAHIRYSMGDPGYSAGS